MSKFKYIFSHGGCELVFSDSSGRGAEIIFPKGTSGEVIVGSKRFPVVSGCATLNLGSLEDGIYTPRLLYNGREIELYPIKKEGNRITHPGYTADELCTRIDELRRTRSALRELSEKHKQLEEYILGKGLF